MSGITFRHWVNLKLALRFHALLIVTILSLWRAHTVTIVIIWGETYLCLCAIRRGIPSLTTQWGLYSVCAALCTSSLAGTAEQLSTSAVTIQTILHILPEVYMKCATHVLTLAHSWRFVPQTDAQGLKKKQCSLEDIPGVWENCIPCAP